MIGDLVLANISMVTFCLTRIRIITRLIEFRNTGQVKYQQPFW